MTGDTLPMGAVGWGDGIEVVTGETLGRHVLPPPLCCFFFRGLNNGYDRAGYRMCVYTRLVRECVCVGEEREGIVHVCLGEGEVRCLLGKANGV